MSPKHKRTVAIINGPEKYETSKTSLSYFFDEVNGLIDKGTINVDGQHIQLEFFSWRGGHEISTNDYGHKFCN